MRQEMRERFGHLLPDARVLQDITGHGAAEFRSIQLWPNGPSWDQIPPFAKPEAPGADNFPAEKKPIWDLWLTDYNSRFHEHIFADCPFNTFNKGAPRSSTRGGQKLEFD